MPFTAGACAGQEYAQVSAHNSYYDRSYAQWKKGHFFEVRLLGLTPSIIDCRESPTGNLPLADSRRASSPSDAEGSARA